MITGPELREVRLAAGIGLGKLSARCQYSKPYLGLVETGKRAVTADVVAAYERALGVGLGDDQDVNRRNFLTATVLAASNAVLLGELTASLAGGDPNPLATVQTSHAVDHALAAQLDGATVRKLARWASEENSSVVRVNAAGILAKLPGQAPAGHVVSVLRRDQSVQDRYLTAVVARVCGIDHELARQYMTTPTLMPSPMLVAQRLSAEALNPNDAGARWCAATMLARLSPQLGQTDL
ncbi:helix-turn-helix domain-containing protein [Nocardia sp. NBC_00511]|uniref:helix-turn-helix domain-containing protein n=1 Tax=Nocardia sp. NBC_00511 TaxID=2903591 RepID=UPI00386D4F1A